MDLSKYSIEDLLLTAMKSEAEARDVYTKLAESVDNAFMQERLRFLAGEEKKHQDFVGSIFKKKFPGKDIILPKTSPVPMPHIKMDDNTPLSDVFQSAMLAEQTAFEFYNSFADVVDDEGMKNTLRYFASMELSHYHILEGEKEVLENFEDFDTEWPMMHIGP